MYAWEAQMFREQYPKHLPIELVMTDVNTQCEPSQTNSLKNTVYIRSLKKVSIVLNISGEYICIIIHNNSE